MAAAEWGSGRLPTLRAADADADAVGVRLAIPERTAPLGMEGRARDSAAGATAEANIVRNARKHSGGTAGGGVVWRVRRVQERAA